MKNCRYPLFSKLLVLFSLLLMLFGLVQDLPLVLCFEPNGQIELEAATAKGSCVDWLANARSFVGRPQWEASSTTRRIVQGLFHHCVDLPLSRLSPVDKSYKVSVLNPAQWTGVWLLHRVIESLEAVPELGMADVSSFHWAKPPPIMTGRKILSTVILLL